MTATFLSDEATFVPIQITHPKSDYVKHSNKSTSGVIKAHLVWAELSAAECSNASVVEEMCECLHTTFTAALDLLTPLF